MRMRSNRARSFKAMLLCLSLEEIEEVREHVNPPEHYDLFKGEKSMNYVLAIHSMNLFCTNCQEALHQV